MRDLRLNISDTNKHPQLIMKELGITYKRAVIQSLGEQWWFFDCENIPDNLPDYLEVLKLSPKNRKYWYK